MSLLQVQFTYENRIILETNVLAKIFRITSDMTDFWSQFVKYSNIPADDTSHLDKPENHLAKLLLHAENKRHTLEAQVSDNLVQFDVDRDMTLSLTIRLVQSIDNRKTK
jgi:predicted phage-related endonuclease